MKLPVWAREVVEVAKEFGLAFFSCGLGVTALTLVMMGLAIVLQWPIQEILEYYTPLLLGLFSIAITLYLFQRNIREGRDRAKRERDQNVRPILLAKAVGLTAKKNGYFGCQEFEKYECIVDSGNVDRKLYVKLENFGLGVALNVEVFIKCLNGEFYLVAYEVPKVEVNGSAFLEIRCTLPSNIGSLITSYKDIFDNTHFCLHPICDDYIGPDQMVIGNEYSVDFPRDREESERFNKALQRRPLTRETYLVVGYTVDPEAVNDE
ncbi:hypothetical protein [Marinobacter confluentis]|uniref:Uncharacterized protein n=1 Tax=Marinobacter confluentis TaxID=1697557 RepID=A0A4Z1BV82_9GAMM|nr:hypothetical protein [Marinobacter confluentis]TGN41349.1 hypothetical protein E5Q11_02040 [Marinobacter confluentis]